MQRTSGCLYINRRWLNCGCDRVRACRDAADRVAQAGLQCLQAGLLLQHSRRCACSQELASAMHCKASLLQIVPAAASVNKALRC